MGKKSRKKSEGLERGKRVKKERIIVDDDDENEIDDDVPIELPKLSNYKKQKKCKR